MTFTLLLLLKCSLIINQITPRLDIPSLDILGDIPRHTVKIILRMSAHRYGENGVQLLQTPCLRLRKTEVGVGKAEDVPGRVPAEGSLLGERLHESRPGQGKDEVEAPARCCCEGHAHIAEVERL